MNWSRDHAGIDRALFIRSHRRLRVTNFTAALITERNFWRLLAVCGAYLLWRCL